ncbi:MAG: hypothetical protein EZS28_016701 [Streblomastix strix]|uniref:Tyr recombinase domain-containing protein n=1 Tax=Streblomastix strix TaxID=222440 RepID=A0A5J4VYV2_9EUKA|nr:MAG: hypothetical protein EZS28_016701 [Streblomastix strix]
MALLAAFTAARITQLTRMRRKNVQIEEQKTMLQTKIMKEKKIRNIRIELKRRGTSYCPDRALESGLMDVNALKEEGDSIWIIIEKKKRLLSPQECGQFFRKVLDEIGIEKDYGGVTIRNAKMTTLRREGATQEKVNAYMRHAQESNIEDVFFNKPVRRDLNALLLLKKIIYDVSIEFNKYRLENKSKY